MDTTNRITTVLRAMKESYTAWESSFHEEMNFELIIKGSDLFRESLPAMGITCSMTL